MNYISIKLLEKKKYVIAKIYVNGLNSSIKRVGLSGDVMYSTVNIVINTNILYILKLLRE